MEFLAIVRIAFHALSRNKLRTGLTMLGMIIGVGAVIAMVGIGQGAQNQVQQQIANLGTNMLFITAGSASVGGFRMGSASVKTLTVDDSKAIRRECTAVESVAPGVNTAAQVVYQNQNWSTRLTGSTPSYFDIRLWPMKAGVSFSDQDVEASANVAVLGTTVVENLFAAGDNPVGKTIRIKNEPFRVVGVAESKGQASWGMDQDDIIFVPYTTAQKKLMGTTWLNFVTVQAVSKEATAVAQNQIEGLLRQRHHLRGEEESDFMVRNLADIAELADQAGQVMTLLLGSIASVSLIVGGIGIMNIMLVSVTERTREIGIRMAIGATERDVHWQFLVEAVVISVAGGMIGVLLGVSGSTVISRVLRWPSLVSPLAIVVAVLFSVGVGVFFGYYPARKAARLDPIEALRFE